MTYNDHDYLYHLCVFMKIGEKLLENKIIIYFKDVNNIKRYNGIE